jgi:hypothetical protein
MEDYYKTTEHDKKPEVLDTGTITIIIPRCCREGLDSCIHVVKKQQKKRKTNPGL